MLGSFFPSLHRKRVCVVGSRDNYAAFALAAMGSEVVSTDISQKQLDIAARRAVHLGFGIRFVRVDAAELSSAIAQGFDLALSSNGLFVWLADLPRVFTEVSYSLAPGGFYIFYDVTPSLRPWKGQAQPIEMKKPYWECGLFKYQHEDGCTSYEFHWPLGSVLNALIEAGLAVRRIVESPSRDSRFWKGPSYLRKERCGSPRLEDEPPLRSSCLAFSGCPEALVTGGGLGSSPRTRLPSLTTSSQPRRRFFVQSHSLENAITIFSREARCRVACLTERHQPCQS